MSYKLDASVKEYVREAASPFQEDGRLNIARFCESKGIRVLEAKFAKDNISGAIRKENDNGVECWTIYVNRTDSIRRKRFTIAHELGHYLSYQKGSKSKAHMDETGMFQDAAIAKRDGVVTEAEKEANEIAGELLMPAGSVNLKIDEGMNVEELANFFGVSESAMTVRLRNLGFRLLEDQNGGTAVEDAGIVH